MQHPWKEHGIPFDGIAGGKTRILIVDDEQEIVDVLEGALDQANYEVHGDELVPGGRRVRPLQAARDAAGPAPGRDLRAIRATSRAAHMVRSDDDPQMTKIIAMSGR